MFSRSRLVGTPQRNRTNVATNDFTPIGVKSSHYEPVTDTFTNTRSTGRSLFQPIADIPKEHESFADTTFEYTTDSIHSIDQPTIQSYHPQARSDKDHNNNNNNFSKNLINNGAASVKEQDDRIRELNSENYILRLKVIDLQKFLRGTPEEQRQVLSENFRLREELTAAISHIEKLKLLQGGQSTNDEYLHEKVTSYEHQLQEKDNHIDGLEKELRESRHLLNLANNTSHTNQDDLIQKLHISQQENHNISLQLNDLKSTNNSLASENENLHSKIQELIHSNKEISNGSESSISSLRDQIKALEATCENLSESRSSLKKEVDNWKRQYESLQSTINNSHTEFDHERDSLLSELNKLRSQVEFNNKELQDSSKSYHILTEEIESKDRALAIKSQELDSLKASNERLNDELTSIQREKLNNDDAQFSIKSQLRTYEMQIESLKSQLKHGGIADNQLHQSQQQVIELQERVNYYEHEYENLKTKYESSSSKTSRLELELDDLKIELARLKSEKSNLDHKIETVTGNHLSSKELMSRLTHDKQKLEDINDKLTEDLKSKTRELEFLKLRSNNENRDLDTKFDNLISENTELKTVIDNYSKKLRDLDLQFRDIEIELDTKTKNSEILKYQIEKLQNTLREKEEMYKEELFITNNRVKNFSSNNNNSTNNNQELTDYLKLKSNQDASRILKLEQDIESLRKDYQIEITRYKDKISSLESQIDLQKELIRNSQESKSNDPSPVQALLELQLKEASKSSQGLTQELNEAVSRYTAAEINLKRLEKDNAELLNSMISEESKNKSIKNESISQQIKVNELKEELLTAKSHCKKLANKVEELMQENILSEKLSSKLKIQSDNDLNKSNQYLQRKVQVLNKKLQSSSNLDNSDKTILLENELTYYKAKLYDMNLRANDLQIMYLFAINSIKNSDKSLRNELYNLTRVGIYPDYSSMRIAKLKQGKRLTFKQLALFVLAGIRIKRRCEKSQKRKLKLEELKDEIDYNKIKLLQ
ncbi:hypothetical protein DFJ63DRAFT_206462 [Scheffersomyces coipomensis]|uniref:uncharacterized protein n=1 Tax=Scheffersomyces coipomensis TaxID=1788519 RepID=UPI00315C6D1F